MKALSIRQPWAWAIIYAGKDIENRDWSTRYRGLVLIHASKGMTRDEYRSATMFIERVVPGIAMPHPLSIERGGIVGIAELVDSVSASDSPWFVGRYGFVLRDVRPLPFRPLRGELGLFDVDGEVAA